MNLKYKNQKIFAFSDTHGMYRRLSIPKDVDILICAGDGVMEFTPDELRDFLEWFASIPAKLRIFVAGNHELLFELSPHEAAQMIPDGIIFLEDEGIEYEDISFYSVPARAWLHQDIILPNNIDFLITHGPALGFLDEESGCPYLRNAILDGKPRIHIFGHIHSQGGKSAKSGATTFYNVSYFEQLNTMVNNLI